MDDLISRQQAIDALKEKVFRNLTDEFYGAMQVLDELPSAQPETNCSEIPNNSDTISRQAVTKFLNDWLSCLFENCHKQSASDLKMIIKDFKNLPSAQPETNCSEIPNNWIPCRERLPEEGEVVLAQAKFKDDVKMAVSSRFDYNYWTGDYNYWTGWGTRDINIIAWMPLPEPYQEGGEQE